MSKVVVKNGMIGLIIIAYPLIVYYILEKNLPWFAIVLILGIFSWKTRHRKDWYLWIGAALVVIAMTSYFLGPEFISKFAPFLIHLSLFLIFWQSLRSTPLITLFAQFDFPVLPPEIIIYCRSLTKVWAAFFAFNVVMCLWLALYASNSMWAIYNGIIIYILIFALIIGEYVFRRIKYPDLEVPTLSESVQNIIKNGHQIWGKNAEYLRETR